jgi:hypothetical protein
MKYFNCIYVYVGLAGKYTSEKVIQAKNSGSARKKAMEYVGDRSLESLTINEVIK